MLNMTAIRLASMLVGLGAVGLAVQGGQAHSSDGPAHCEIQASSTGGMIALEGVVHADTAISGSYRFRVVSAGNSGNSNIQQGGGFTVGASDSVTLGRVMLGGSGAAYDASLTVNANGKTVSCEERVGGAI